MTSQEGFSLLKSCARRSFSFTCGNLQGFATHGLRNTALRHTHLRDESDRSGRDIRTPPSCKLNRRETQVADCFH